MNKSHPHTLVQKTLIQGSTKFNFRYQVSSTSYSLIQTNVCYSGNRDDFYQFIHFCCIYMQPHPMICNTNPRGKDFRIFSHKHYNHVFKYFPSTVEFRNIYFLIYYTFIRWLYWSCLKAQSPDSFGMNSTNYLKGLMDTK